MQRSRTVSSGVEVVVSLLLQEGLIDMTSYETSTSSSCVIAEGARRLGALKEEGVSTPVVDALSCH